MVPDSPIPMLESDKHARPSPGGSPGRVCLLDCTVALLGSGDTDYEPFYLA